MKMTNPLNILRKAHPIVSSGRKAWEVSLGVGSFVFLFLYIFQPFELDSLERNKALTLGGYGVISFLVLLFFLLAQRFTFKEKTWTTGKQVIFYLLLINTIAVLNFHYTKSYNPAIGLSTLNFIFYTFSVALFPIGFITITQQRRLEKKHLKQSEVINQQLQTSQPSTASLAPALKLTPTDQIPITLSQQDVLFIESEGNYLWIHEKSDPTIRKHKVRGTITNILKELDSIIFQKTHRAFIVNLNHIVHISGNAQGLKLQLEHTTEEIPVARSFVTSLKERLRN